MALSITTDHNPRSPAFSAKDSDISPKGSGDPLIVLIENYKAQLRVFKERAGSEDWDALSGATYMPFWDELCNCPPAPTTYAGAVAGLEFLNDELKENDFSEAQRTVLRRCLAFLRAH